MTGLTKKFPTKKQMSEVGVHNSYNLAALTDQKVFIAWSPQQTGRYYRLAHFAVVHIGYKTDPKGHWQDDGHKSFHIYGGDTRDGKAAEAMSWANKKFSKRSWVRDPFGSYQDPQALECAWELVMRKEEEPK